MARVRAVTGAKLIGGGMRERSPGKPDIVDGSTMKAIGRYLAITLATIGWACAVGAEPIDPDATPETRALLDRLHAQAGKGVLLGHQDALAYGIDWKEIDGKSDVRDLCGAYPAVFGWDLGDIDQERNLDGVSFAKMKVWVRQADAMGGINTFSLHLDHPRSGRSAWDNEWVVEDLLPGRPLHEKFCQTWDRVAEFLADLKREDGTLIPVILRPYHEHSERWPWWGRTNCYEDEFIALWRMTVDYLRKEKGVHHVLYAISPQDVVDEADYLDGYPGDAYVDIFGLDYYKIWRPEEVIKMGEALSLVARLAHERGKVSALTETGIERVPIANWWTGRLLAALKHDEWSRRTAWALVWRNKSRGHHFGPFPGHESATDFFRFSQDPLIVMGKRSGELQGFGSAGLEKLHAAQESLVEDGICLANVATVVRDGHLVYHRAVSSGHPGDPPIEDNTLFAIWSMTKPITSVAAMMLHERGLFELDDPVSDVLPQLGNLRVKTGDGKTEALKRPITYRHLLTHQAGFYGYDGSFHEEGTWKQVMKLPDLAALIDLLEGRPLEHQPGERYTYGLSTAVLGRAIEGLTGKSLAAFMQDEIFDVLKMRETRFSLSKADRERFQPLFVEETGKGFRRGTEAEDELFYNPDSALYLGGEGLVSTMGDYGRFCQMLLDRGRPLLAPETLDLMLKDELVGIPGYGDTDGPDSMGLGFYVHQRASGDGDVIPPGIFGWGGYHTTHFWIDPKHQFYAIFMTRRYPYSDDTLARFRQGVYEALTGVLE